MKLNKKIYSKENIQDMVFKNSLLKEYQDMLEGRYKGIAILGGIAGLVVVGIPIFILAWALYEMSQESINNGEYGSFLGAMAILIVGGIILFFIVFIIVSFFLNKIFGKPQTFKEFSEPIFLGYELALKRYEVENRVQDLEFMFENKEFFHGLDVVKGMLRTRNMELENQLKLIPIERQNQENEIFKQILERKLENQKQTDWLEEQMRKMESL